MKQIQILSLNGDKTIGELEREKKRETNII